MSEKKPSLFDKIFDKASLRLLAVIVLAFLASIFHRQSMGIWAMTPISLILCAVSAFIPVKSRLKISCFAIMFFSTNTVEQSDMNRVILYTATGVATIALFELSVRLMKRKGIGKNKPMSVPTVLFTASAVISYVLVISFFGNPLTAYNAKAEIDSYIDKTYPTVENASLGNFEFSSIYYRSDLDCYAVSATSSVYPTESGSISCANGIVRDGFGRMMEEKISESYVLEFTDILRKSFPDDGFSVEFDGFSVLPGESPLSAKSGELRGKVDFQITIKGIQSATEMLERVEGYMREIEGSEIEYSTIVFKSGTGPWVRRSITVKSHTPKMDISLHLTRVPAGTSNGFNRYLDIVFE